MTAPRGDDAVNAGETRPDEGSGGGLPVWQETLLLLALALALATGIKVLLAQAFYIPSGSMEQTLRIDDRILVEKPSYWFGSPQRGDVVVFADPGGWLARSDTPKASNPVTRSLELVGLYPTGGHLVKRVIGVGGDEVTCCDALGRVTVNGTPLDEAGYLKPGRAPSLVEFDSLVPEGYLWMMGDNRPGSSDSRFHLGDPGGGMVPVDAVVGKVVTVIWPLGDLDVLHRPATFADVPAPR